MLDLAHYWYRPRLHWLGWLLLPFARLFALITACRRQLYRCNILKTAHFPVPVIVVGNITVGGTGKTPLVIWLADFLRQQGYRPGIVSRGVGGKKHTKAHQVQQTDAPQVVGDEALLLLEETQCPVVICKSRKLAVQQLLAHTNCNLVISDDGLQHYSLGRAIEIAVVDGLRKFGNKQLLPAGPLREPVSRLHQVDFIVMNGETAYCHPSESWDPSLFKMEMIPYAFKSLLGKYTYHLADFKYKKIHALAGIGHPQRFFNVLAAQGFDLITHVFPDHYLYQACDIQLSDQLPIVMTAKDAIKCKAFADERHWYLQIKLNMPADFAQALLRKIQTFGVVYA